MIVITSPAGQIGRQVLANLLSSGEELRVIARDPSKIFRPASARTSTSSSARTAMPRL